MHAMAAQPGARDAGIATIWALIGLASLQLGAIRMWGSLALADASIIWFYVTLAVMVVISLMRSRRPALTLALAVAVTALDVAIGGSLGVVIIFTDAIYVAVKYGSERTLRWLLRIALAAVLLVGVTLLIAQPVAVGVLSFVLQWSLIIVISAVWGWNVRSERARTERELTRQFAGEQEVLRRQIAGELHDRVANQIAVAGLHIEAAKLQVQASTSPEAPNRDANVAAGAGNSPPGSLRQESRALTSLDHAKQGTDRAHEQLRGLISVLHTMDELDKEGPVEIDIELAALVRLLPEPRRLVWGDGARASVRAAVESARQPRVVMRALQELVANAAKYGCEDATVEAAPDHIVITNPRDVDDNGDLARRGNATGLATTAHLLRGIGGSLTASHELGDVATWRAEIRLSNEANA